MLYADDAVLLCSDKISRKLKHKSETEMQENENRVEGNTRKINFAKTNYTIFSNQTKTNKPEKVCINITNGTFPVQKRVKYF